MRDEALAKQLNRTVVGVAVRGTKLKIPAFNRQARPWSAEEEKLLGQIPDREFARRFNRTLQAVQLHRTRRGILLPGRGRPWTPREDKLLGTLIWRQN